jgi:hypothetical protein
MAIGALMLVVALSCVLAPPALNWYATSLPGAGLPVTLCVGFTAAPRVQIGASWQSLLSSYLSPLAFSPFAACLHVPHAWVAPNPQVHSWEWLWP